MKKLFITLSLLATLVPGASASEIPAGNKPNSDVQIVVNQLEQIGNEMNVNLDLNFSQVNFQRNKEAIYTPMIVNGADTVKFTPFTLAGHNRYIYNLRNGQLAPVLFKGYGSDRGEMSKQSVPSGYNYQFTESGDGYVNCNYKAVATFKDWMSVSTFVMRVEDIGCANCGKTITDYPLAYIDYTPSEYISDFLYVTPVAEEIKTRELSGRAYIDFKVNQTNILPDYRNNRVELNKILATIDSIKSDQDITIRSIEISGTASPEGSYENNVRLAKGRTDALVEYVQKLYKFPEGLLKTSYNPVDWAGLKEWLQNNDIENRDEILGIVDGDLEPYARNQKIKTTYPKQYAYLLENVYPSLRHSDYVIEFNIRKYKDVQEITEVMLASPQKLSLNELFLVANSQPEGSDLYNQSFELAAMLYPDDETANLNAGTNAIRRGDFVSAQKYLKKAGNSDEAKFTRAVYEALNGDKALALKEFKALAVNASSESLRHKAAVQAESLEASMQKFTNKFTPVN
ncbi:MAG: DUF3868 domain-containing protein [Muribaculaceae bacterium]|nr:DUF3868 domain-containing protein [Muribaculaceae bacterium]